MPQFDDVAEAEYAVSYATEWRDALLAELYVIERRYRCDMLAVQLRKHQSLEARERVRSASRGLVKIISHARSSYGVEPVRPMEDVDLLPTNVVFVHSDQGDRDHLYDCSTY